MARKDIDTEEQEVEQETESQDDTELSLVDLIKEQAQEEDADPRRSNITLRKIIGGEILTAEVVRKQIWVVVLVTLFILVYIAEGYSYKQYMLSIDKLNEELRDAKYRALSVKSDLTESTRRSKIIDLLKTNHDSLLHTADHPAYVIEVPE